MLLRQAQRLCMFFRFLQDQWQKPYRFYALAQPAFFGLRFGLLPIGRPPREPILRRFRLKFDNLNFSRWLAPFQSHFRPVYYTFRSAPLAL